MTTNWRRCETSQQGWLKANDAKLARAIADGFVQEIDNDQSKNDQRKKET